MVDLAIYRTLAYSGPQTYFLAPAGLHAHNAAQQRVSPYYTDQITALGALIDKQHETNASSREA